MSEKAPLSPVGANRTTTIDSSSGGVAIPAECGDVGGLLVERLRAWKHAIGYLEAYISQTESVHRVLSKEYQKVLKTVDEPLREGHHFSQSVGGLASFFENVRANTVRLSTSHTETAGELKSTVLPILERLHKEIKDRQKHVQNECEKSAKAVLKTRNATQGHIELLGQHISAFGSVAVATATTIGKAKPENDPFLLKKGVLSRLAKQVLEENAQRQDLIGTQNHSQQFEIHIVQVVQQAIATFNQVLHAQADLQKQLYGDILEKGNAIPPDFEWVNFLTRCADTLIDPASPKRTVESIRFPNEDHYSTKPLMEGSLSRKGKIMRSYNPAYYVITPSKYLHQFKDLDTLNRDPEPELSLYIPECTVGPLKEGKFQISGKDAGSRIGTKHDFAFKASNAAEGQKWYDAITRGSKMGPIGPPKDTVVVPVAPGSPPPPPYSGPSSPVSPSGQELGTIAATAPPTPPAPPATAVVDKVAAEKPA